MNKTIGILGGMGTFATLHFLKCLTELSEPDEFRFILDNTIHILERTKAVKEGREDEVESGLVNSLITLCQTKAVFTHPCPVRCPVDPVQGQGELIVNGCYQFL